MLTIKVLRHATHATQSLFHVGIKYKHAETETEHHFLYDIEQSGMRPQRKKKQQQHRGRQRAAPLEVPTFCFNSLFVSPPTQI